MAVVSAGCWEHTASCLVHEKVVSKQYKGGQEDRYFVSKATRSAFKSDNCNRHLKNQVM